MILQYILKLINYKRSPEKLCIRAPKTLATSLNLSYQIWRQQQVKLNENEFPVICFRIAI